MTTKIQETKKNIKAIELRLRNFPREVTMHSPKLAILQKELITLLEQELINEKSQARHHHANCN